MFTRSQPAVDMLIDPHSLCNEEIQVDVDMNHNISYGGSVSGEHICSCAEGAQRRQAQYDVDFDGSIRR